jgi:hypothetical protein
MASAPRVIDDQTKIGTREGMASPKISNKSSSLGNLELELGVLL